MVSETKTNRAIERSWSANLDGFRPGESGANIALNRNHGAVVSR